MQRERKRSFAENIRVLLEELKLAEQWNRPSILLAVCDTRSGQTKAQNELKSKLEQLGLRIIEIEVNSRLPFVSRQIVSLSVRDKVVFFVSNIGWGGGQDRKDAYRNLNMDREALVENQVKAVFWLTRAEAQNLPADAPDFWAFRHRVVEFATPRTGEKIKLPASLLIWHGQNPQTIPENLEERIDSYQQLIRDLPNKTEARSSRIELLYSIGYLYWAKGDAARALESLRAGQVLADRPEFSVFRSWVLNGIAILHYEKGEYAEAAEIYEELLIENPTDSILRIDYSLTLCAMGKYARATLEGKKATKQILAEARIWNRLGYIYLSAGKLEEAVSSFKKAIDLAPSSAAFYESLAIGYHVFGLTEDALNQLRLAHNRAGFRLLFNRVYEETLRGNPGNSLNLLKEALSSKQISEADLRQDFNSQIMLAKSPSNFLSNPSSQVE